MNAKELLIAVLEPFGYPVRLQGSMSAEEAYPDSFFTFFNNGTDDSSFYNNSEHRTVWDFDLNIYSNDPSVVNTAFDVLKPLLKAAGFIVNGKGYDVLSDEPTHTGRGINLIYIEEV